MSRLLIAWVLSLSAFLVFQLPGWNFSCLFSASFGGVLNKNNPACFAWEDSDDGFSLLTTIFLPFLSIPAAKTAWALNLQVTMEMALREKSFFLGEGCFSYLGKCTFPLRSFMWTVRWLKIPVILSRKHELEPSRFAAALPSLQYRCSVSVFYSLL